MAASPNVDKNKVGFLLKNLPLSYKKPHFFYCAFDVIENLLTKQNFRQSPCPFLKSNQRFTGQIYFYSLYFNLIIIFLEVPKHEHAKSRKIAEGK